MVAIKTATQTFYHAGDHLSSTRVVTDASGNAVETISYLPYGGTQQDNSSVSLNYKYTGQEQDSEIGLYNYGARLYDPDLGRFISSDTVVQHAADPQTLNRYSYARNNPLLYTDPSGHFFLIDDIIIGAAIGAAVGATTAAITHHDVGMGALTGAVGGAFFGAAGFAINYFEVTDVFTQAAIHAAAGAGAGAVNASITHQNVGIGAAVGGISAAVADSANSFVPQDNFVEQLTARTVIGGVIGGSVSATLGGDFGQGFRDGAITGALGYLANHEAHKYIDPAWKQAATGIWNALKGGWNGSQTAWQNVPDPAKAALTIATGGPFAAALGPEATAYLLRTPVATYVLTHPDGAMEIYDSSLDYSTPSPNLRGAVGSTINKIYNYFNN